MKIKSHQPTPFHGLGKATSCNPCRYTAYGAKKCHLESFSQGVSRSILISALALGLLSACGGSSGRASGSGSGSEELGSAKARGVQDTAATATLPHRPSTDLPNVVLIAIDSFRPDHMYVNGYRRLTTAYLEGLIPRAALFQNTYSTSSLSAPSTASLLTSLYSPTHGVTEGTSAHQQRAHTIYQLSEVDVPLGTLASTTTTLPEVLQANGYRTNGFSSNPELDPTLKLFRGFDTFRHLPNQDARTLTRLVLKTSSQILEPQPSFLYLQFSDPQKPYHFRRPWFRNSSDPKKQAIAAYNSELSYVDRELLRLHEELGWDRNTLLIIVSTHGEALWDHGHVGHGLSLHDEEVRVLLLVFGPSLAIPSRTIQTNTSLVDVAPTILDLLQLPFDSRDGLTLSHLLAKRPPRGVVQRFRGRTLFAHRQKHRATAGGKHYWMAVRGPLKLLSDPTGDTLFHTLNDPGATHDLLADGQPLETANLQRALAAFKQRNRLAEEPAAPPPKLSTSEKIQRLLGRETGNDGG
jgi:arylsulfatase A-like enzyme